MRRVGLVLAVLFVLAQLVPVPRTNPPATGELSAPLEIDGLLQRACYDCHSNETRWPWYAYVAPASWLVAWDVNEGREHLNFSTWRDYAPARQRKKLEEIAEMIERDEMPLWYYRPLHPDAELTAAERAQLVAWARGWTAAPAE
ncbi:MAG TPA: heme-binding domain-containing protein [Vicinamibacterales bacterium]|nr:heme-binding domain-containing protein [Vicinamibacterales bacterium]